jgi:hypothetical protein
MGMLRTCTWSTSQKQALQTWNTCLFNLAALWLTHMLGASYWLIILIISWHLYI